MITTTSAVSLHVGTALHPTPISLTSSTGQPACKESKSCLPSGCWE